MKIAVLGTGTVGRAIAGRLHDLGHEVVVGTRDPQATLCRTGPDAMGTPAFAEWLAAHPEVRLATFAEAAARRELVVNASSGTATLEALGLAGEDGLAGKVVLDIVQPAGLLAGLPAHACSSRTPTRWPSRCSAPSRGPGWSRRSTR